MLSAVCFNLDQSKILSSGNGLSEVVIVCALAWLNAALMNRTLIDQPSLDALKISTSKFFYDLRKTQLNYVWISPHQKLIEFKRKKKKWNETWNLSNEAMLSICK